MNKTPLQFKSFAKINWTLRILGRRDDGYHEIDTILQTVSLHDDLTFEHREDDKIILHSDSPDIPNDKTNLIVQAANALREFANVRAGVEVQLTKCIPAQGGLGGASSNAAITLVALNRLWETRLDPQDLEGIGARLGADVPFFFTGGTARARGTGSTISALEDANKSYLLIVTPNARVSTAAAYQALKAPSLTTNGATSILSSSFAEPISSDSDQWALSNDFEGVIFEREPEIKRVHVALFDAGAQGGLLAGSGSSVFGIFESKGTRERALADLKLENGWQVFPCETVSRAEYLESLRSSGFPQLRSLKFQTDTGA
jgi:4-diphosphocytidyl-2-C-methyl-D-erythritol kinase